MFKHVCISKLEKLEQPNDNTYITVGIYANWEKSECEDTIYLRLDVY